MYTGFEMRPDTDLACPSIKEETVLTKSQIGILQHSLGIRIRGDKSYRNHFVAGPGHHDYSDLMALVRAGMMREHPASQITGGSQWFQVTDSGWTAAFDALPEPPKRTRYGEYLDADGCAGDSFGEFLCGGRLPEFESRRDLRRADCGRLIEIIEYRMFRNFDFWTRDVQGGWCSTKKDAKASYKAALKASKEHQNA
ncbi:hypothetical protein [Pandoraea communis]|uniref:hypothetical protein n=1 Tax=Pandoraea communis TaxID=2508297 RepID=UPI0025A58539|nr:hypothetical protein [Pandoraea communis]MDM8356581.1 hypothetical protein [Pandoraea communis]